MTAESKQSNYDSEGKEAPKEIDVPKENKAIQNYDKNFKETKKNVVKKIEEDKFKEGLLEYLTKSKEHFETMEKELPKSK